MFSKPMLYAIIGLIITLALSGLYIKYLMGERDKFLSELATQRLIVQQQQEIITAMDNQAKYLKEQLEKYNERVQEIRDRISEEFEEIRERNLAGEANVDAGKVQADINRITNGLFGDISKISRGKK